MTYRNDRSDRDDAVIDEITPVDPDISLVADYLAGEATPEQAAEFERRFVEDEAFYEDVAPAIKAWNTSVSFGELAARQTVLNVPAAPAPAPALAPAPVPEVAQARAPRNKLFTYRRTRRWINTVLQLALAAGLLLTVGIQALLYFRFRNSNDVKLVKQALQDHTDAVAAATNQPGQATVIPAVPAVGSNAPRVVIPPGVTRIPAPTGAAPKLRPPDATPDTIKAQNELVKSVVIAMGEDVRTGASETKVVEIGGVVRVRLAPNTAMRATTGLIKLPGIAAPMAIYFEGEIAVDIPVAGRDAFGGMTAIGSAGVVTTPGLSYEYDGKSNRRVPTSFAARCAVGCASLDVAVASGDVRLSAALIGSETVHVEKGGFGRAPAHGPPILVSAADAIGFPRPDPSIRKQP